MPEHQCDFCDSHEIAWRYRAESFELPTTLTVRGIELTFPWGSIGDWAACEACSALIEAEEWDALAQKGMETNPLTPWLSEDEFQAFKKAIIRLHQIFTQKRVGPRMQGWSMPETKEA